jgi:tetratricopeptide (TPR) repeat protein
MWRLVLDRRCQLLLLVILGVAVRAPALSGQFIWDDEFLARDNPLIKSPLLILETFRHYLFFDSLSVHYRPVQNLSYMLDYWLWDNNTFGFHLTNIVFHVGSGILLLFLLRRIFPTLRSTGNLPPAAPSEKKIQRIELASFCVALIWVVHPLHSAAIDYIAGRADSIAFFFAAAGWLLYLRAVERRTVTRCVALFSLAAFFALLALCTRETALVWMVIFLLHTLFFHRDIGKNTKVATVLVCLTLVASYGALRHLPETRPAHSFSDEFSAPMRLALMFRALGDYGRLLIFPSNLHMERTVLIPDEYLNTQSWRQLNNIEFLSIAGLAMVAILTVGCCFGGKSRTIRVFGALWFLVGFLPISNLINLNATVAEHWLYLPSVGLLIFATGCMMDLPSWTRRPAIAAILCAVAGFSVGSAVRSSDWVSPETFYQRTIAAGGGTMRMLICLGHVYADQGQDRKAEELFRKILSARPDYDVARTNLGAVLAKQHKNEEASAMLTEAAHNAKLAPDDTPRGWQAARNLAILLHAQKNDAAAIAQLDQARAAYPDVWELVSSESELLRQQHDQKRPLQLVRKFAAKNWWHYNAALALGRLYVQTGDNENAARALQHASDLDIHEVVALDLIARLRLGQNRLEDAFRAQKRAVARQPDAPRQYALLSDILSRMGRKTAADDATAEVARLEAIGRSSRALLN